MYASLNLTLSAIAVMHFGLTLPVRSIFRESVDFQKKCLIFMIFKKFKNWSMGLGRTFHVSNFLQSITSRHYSKDAKEADILDRCGLPLNGVKLGGV